MSTPFDYSMVFKTKKVLYYFTTTAMKETPKLRGCRGLFLTCITGGFYPIYWYIRYKMDKAGEEVRDMTQKAQHTVDTLTSKDYNAIVHPKSRWADQRIRAVLKYMMGIPEFDSQVGGTFRDVHSLNVEFGKTGLGIKLSSKYKKGIAYNDIEKVTYEIRQGINDTNSSSTTDGAIVGGLIAGGVGAIVGGMHGNAKAMQSSVVLVIHHKLEDGTNNKIVIFGKQQDGAEIRGKFHKFFPGTFEVLGF